MALKDRTTCHFCKRELYINDHGVHQYTKGWVKLRSDGGGHAIALAERELKWAHAHCIDRAKRGTLAQGSLFDTEEQPSEPEPPGPSNAHYDEKDRLQKTCATCGAPDPSWGFDVAAHKGQLGSWFCYEHRPR